VGSSPKPSAPPLLVTPHDRLLQAAKQLFAADGFENTSTAAIARAAGTSESQLIKHFKSKEGLLEAIFQTAWVRMGYVFTAVEVVSSPREKLRMMMELMLNAFDTDPELKDLMLFEGRRLRKEGARLVLTDGYLQFTKKIDGIVQSLADRGKLKAGISAVAVRSALIATLEGMLRDQVVARRMNFPNSSTGDEIRLVFTMMLDGFLGADDSK
jgi:AcrR family transcriptional regulator